MAKWSWILDSGSVASRADGVFADLGSEDWADGPGREGTARPRIRSEAGPAARRVSAVASAYQTPQVRVPQRSPLQRCEVEADAWFAELAGEDATRQ